MKSVSDPLYQKYSTYILLQVKPAMSLTPRLVAAPQVPETSRSDVTLPVLQLRHDDASNVG